MTTASTATTSSEVRPVVSPGAGVWRAVLIVWLVAVAGAMLLAGTRPASLSALEDGLRSGEVTHVRVTGAMEAESVGYAHPEIGWHDGLLDRYTTVRQVQGDPNDQFVGGSDRPVVGGDLIGQLTASTPTGDLQVVTERWHRSHGELAGWKVPTWLALVGVAWAVTTFFTLLSGPEPRWATRWAWFWLFWGSGGLAMVLYVLVGLPRTGQPREPAGRRLTGGWALLLSLLLPSLHG